MKHLLHITTAITLLASMNVSATNKTIDTDYYGKTIFIEADTKEVISMGTGWRGNNRRNGTIEQATPRALGIDNAVSVIASVGRQFILQADGSVWMVDRRSDYNDIKVRPPVQLPISNVSDVEANTHNAYFIVDGSVFQMDIASQGKAELVKGLPNNIVEISVAIFHSVARSANGDIYIWRGKRNSQSDIPQIISDLPAIKAISTARYNTVLTDVDGQVWAMDEGRKGSRTDFNTWSPLKLPINNPQAVVKGYAGMLQTMVLFNDDHVETIKWHNHKRGSDFNMSYKLSAAPALTGIKDMDSGMHSMFIKQDGKVIGLGSNDKGQLGNGLYSETHVAGGILPIIWPESYTETFTLTKLNLK